MLAGAALILLAVACLAGSALAWTGRWRAWARRFPTFFVFTPLGFVPAFGLMLLAAGLILVGAGEPSSPAVAIVFVLAFPLLVLDFIAPKWFAPPWLQAERREHGVQADLTDPLTAVAYAAVGASEDDRPRSTATVRSRFRGADPLARWKAAWVFGDEQGAGPHGLARAGVTEGRLWLYDDGLAFSAGTIEDVLGDGKRTAVIAREDVTGVRTVPARAGADGRPAPGPAARSVFKRLVVDTTDGSYLFEVVRAASKARQIEQTLCDQ
jgi:hypothetical protein